MKHFFTIGSIAFSLFLWGCNRHQYVFVEGLSVTNKTNEYKVENDTLEILYNFSGKDFPVNIKIRNKSANPVYVDWKKSVAIIDGKKLNYWEEWSSIELSGINNFFFDANGVLVKDERITFIPPHSYVETTRIYLQTTTFDNLPESNQQKLRMQADDGTVNVKRYVFSETDSPLTFRSILAISPKESFVEETFFENSFWVSEIIESPKKIMRQYDHQPNGHINNTTTISTKTAFGKTAGTITILGGLTGLLYLASEKSSE